MVHHHIAQDAHPHTQGRTINWPLRYDLLVQVLTLGRARRLRTLIADQAQVKPGELVLDAGCGTGDLALVLARRVGPAGRVVGIDPAREMIARARHKAHRRGAAIDFRVEPVEALSAADGTFDRVVSSLVFHHLPGDLKRQALESLFRVLKPGGQLLIVDALQAEAHLPFHSRQVSHAPAPHLPGLLHAAGFTDIEAGKLRFWSLDWLAARKPPAGNSGIDRPALTP